jgi:peptidoglycan/LPS O-acetylase OafA/YrhL
MLTRFKNELTFPAKHLPVLGALRGLAILMVIFAHFTGNGKLFWGTSLPINLGRYGVEIFFAISGYLMGGILFCKKQEIKIFYCRRFSRIMPALFLYLTFVWAYHISMGYSPGEIPFISTWLLFSNYLLSSDLSVLHRDFAHVWSLCIEEHSYMLLSLIAVISRKWWANDLIKILFVAILFMAIGVVYSVVLEMDYREAYWRTECRAASIFMAAFIAVSLQRNTSHSWNGNWVIGAGALLFALIFNASYFPDALKYTIGSILTSVAVCSLARAEVRWTLVKPIITLLCYIGLISYSLYLWQQFFSAKYHGIWNYIAIIACIIVAALSFIFVEQPMRRKINSFFFRKG